MPVDLAISRLMENVEPATHILLIMGKIASVTMDTMEIGINAMLVTKPVENVVGLDKISALPVLMSAIHSRMVTALGILLVQKGSTTQNLINPANLVLHTALNVVVNKSVISVLMGSRSKP